RGERRDTVTSTGKDAPHPATRGKRSAQAAKLLKASGIKAEWPRLSESRGGAQEPNGETPGRNT
ncbi:hypothetical protein ABS234_19940, partial [Acinetobacter baumannii]|uniref:hypothetical protein n=1 Tax=Acinetobacter baumannii TaxID=470 RepID=UPI00332E786E